LAFPYLDLMDFRSGQVGIVVEQFREQAGQFG
jgi:hypothetical protein